MGRETVFILNDARIASRLPAGTTLLDFIRDERRLTGTRAGCREGDCGACSVLLGRSEEARLRYRAVNSCLLPLGDATGCHVVTVEGLNPPASGPAGLTPVQQAFVGEGASQCGFCTPGFVISLTAFLLNDAQLQLEDALSAVEGNLCRCTGYASIRRAIERLLHELRAPLLAGRERLAALIQSGVLPPYFAAIPERLGELPRAAIETRPGKGAVVVAGGTDLFVQRGGELADREIHLLSRLQEYAGIWPAADSLFIGAAATVADMMESRVLAAALPSLPAFLRRVASPQIRNRATVGGNVVNASPIGDLSVMLLALGAAVGLRQGAKSRRLMLGDFFLGYKKLALRPGEILAWFEVPIADAAPAFHFEKVSRREQQDIASVNSAIGLQLAGRRVVAARAAAGGVAPVPLLLRRASEFLSGREITPAVVHEFIAVADGEIAPISDVRGSAAYKRELLRRLLFAHFLRLFPGRIREGDLG